MCSTVDNHGEWALINEKRHVSAKEIRRCVLVLHYLYDKGFFGIPVHVWEHLTLRFADY